RGGTVDADRPREADGDAAFDDALPPAPARAARSRRAHPEPGRRTVVPDPPHEGGRAAARRGPSGVPGLRRGRRRTARVEASRVAPRRAGRVATGDYGGTPRRAARRAGRPA